MVYQRHDIVLTLIATRENNPDLPLFHQRSDFGALEPFDVHGISGGMLAVPLLAVSASKIILTFGKIDHNLDKDQILLK